VFGFLNIDKPKGITSHDVVARLRRVLKIKQIGHTGTLDPFAVGVLPICVGSATRLIEYLEGEKAYLATVKFGATTDTYDIDGKITQTFDKKITKDDLEKELKNFEGEIEQIPPIYSAIKINGKKLYEYAREGKDVEIKPRKVTIEKIELKSFDEVAQSAEIYVQCSKGTYIRSIAYDIGNDLDCGGYLIALDRVQAGKFLKENSTKLDEITTPSDVEKILLNPLNYLNLQKFEVNEKGLQKIKFGQPLGLEDLSSHFETIKCNDFIILVYNKDVEILCAIAQISEDKILVKKVFIR
jgi:tRNA pseudouridine55 synthase